MPTTEPMTTDRSAAEKLRALNPSRFTGEWFADYGKIGCNDSGIGEMDEPDDAEMAVVMVNALPALADLIEAAEGASYALDFYVKVRPQPDGVFNLEPTADALRASLAAVKAALP